MDTDKKAFLNLTILKSKHGYFAFGQWEGNDCYRVEQLDCYLFDGKKPLPTPLRNWFKIPGVPNLVQRIHPGSQTLVKYVLKTGITPNEVLEAELPRRFSYDDDRRDVLEQFYTPVYEQSPEIIEEISFNINYYDQYNNFKPEKYEFDPQFDLIELLVTPQELKLALPCKIGPAESFKFIRKYIKENLNGKYGFLNSDYDFCLTLCKNIELSESEEYFVHRYKTLRSKKMEKVRKFRRERSIDIFKMCPKLYQDYPLAPSFEADNAEELNEKITEFCKNLIDLVNEPVKDCPHCKGRGVILETFEKFAGQQTKSPA